LLGRMTRIDLWVNYFKVMLKTTRLVC
jgi:hypothetical protein